MRIWFPLLAVPVLALVDQSVAFVTAVWSCSHQSVIAVHVVHAPFFVAAAIGLALAWHAWRERAPARERDDRHARRHFLAGLATGASALSALVILAMWGVTWALRPCVY